jgi:hypothetical protein
MWHAWRGEVFIWFDWEALQEETTGEDQGEDGKIILR